MGQVRRNGQDLVEMVDLARLRQGAYRLFSQSLLYPDDQRLVAIACVAEELLGESGVWGNFAFFEEWSRFLRCLEELRSQDPTALQGEYISNFSVNRVGIPSPIFESAYLEEDTSSTGWLLAGLEGEYRREGLYPSFKDPPDHASVELEFMSFLCDREADAWGKHELSRAIGDLQKERDFLTHHLCWWFPEFASKVATEVGGGVLYAAARAAEAFLVHDKELLDTLLQRFEGVEERL